MIYRREKDLTFEEWCEERRQAEERRTRGAERIHDKAVIDLE